nr:uncharacterized protein LOC107428779 isoform X1 [Ziziphus jujuba var. spinosa]
MVAKILLFIYLFYHVYLHYDEVGKFQRGRTVKEKRQPPICKEGDVIKERQVIGYVEQFGTELPVKLAVRGEVSKILFIVWLYYQLDSIGIGHCLFRRSHR